jgi:hypothetical protein
MGGRRAKSLSDIVGGGLSTQRASFTRALNEQNPEALAASSARLLAGSPRIGQVIYYTAKLSDFVKKAAEASRNLNYEERKALARQEWSRVKKKQGLTVDPIINDAVVSSVAKAIGKSSAPSPPKQAEKGGK